MTPLERHELIISSLRRTRRMYLIATAVTLPTALFMLILAPLSGESTGIVATSMAFGAVFLVTGVLLIRMLAAHWRPERAPLMNVLRDRPRDIVWIYVEEITSRAAGVAVRKYHTIKIALADNKLFTLAVKAADKDRVLAILADYAPQATFGYSRERQKMFKRSPRSLISEA